VASQLTNMMLKVLDYCHTKGIMHRDLKPENFVFDTREDLSNMRAGSSTSAWPSKLVSTPW
jgi:calcium-dependent protein kinase